MKKILPISIIIVMVALEDALSQGWVAEVDLNFNHDLYAQENMSSVTFTFSGVTVSATSPIKTLTLTIKGTGVLTGNFTMSVKGLAWQPYDPANPYSQPISASHSGTYSTACTQGFFEGKGASSQEQVYIWIRIYPRLEIAQFTDMCDRLLLTTKNGCNASLLWEVSEAISGNYKQISGKYGTSISLSRDDLAALGFSDPFGRKYFRVTGRNGTTSQIQAIDISYPPPAAAITTRDPLCHNGNDGAVNVDITGSNPAIINDFLVTLFSDAELKTPVRQQSVNDKFEAAFTGLPSGSYWVKIENNTNVALYGNCWSVYETKPLANPPQITIPVIEVSDFNGFNIQCNGGANGSLRARPSGGTGTYTLYEWTGQVSTSELATNLRAGVYEVRVRDSNNCWSEVFGRTLVEPGKLTAELISTGGKNGFDVSCHDKKDGILETRVSGGVSAYAYLWPDGSVNPALTGAGPGTYTVKVTDMNGCSAAASTTLRAPAPIDFDIAEISGIRCAGEHSGILEAQGIANTIGTRYFAWSSGESTPQITDKPSGTYALTLSDDQGCKTTRHHTLVEPRPWSVDIVPLSNYNGSPIRCHGESNGILAAVVKDSDDKVTAADHYTWFSNGTALASGTYLSELNSLPAATYKVEVTYHNYCKVEEVFVLDEPDAVTADIALLSDYNGVPISCHGRADASMKAEARGGTGGLYAYQWQTGQRTAHLDGLRAGTYTVTATDLNGCTGTAEETVREPEPVDVAIAIISDYNGQPLSCAHAADAHLEAVATGGVGGFNFLWSTGQVSALLPDVPAGRYTVVASDENGCTATSETTIEDPTPVDAMITPASDYLGFGVSCHGSSDGSLSCVATGGTGSYTYQWSNGLDTGPDLHNAPAGEYTVSISDENGCRALARGIITQPDELSLVISAIRDVSCKGGDDGGVTLEASGGAGTYTYAVVHDVWHAEPLINGLDAGSYQAIVRDGNGCRQQSILIVREPPQLDIRFHDIEPALCGHPVGKGSAVATGGNGSYEYSWMNTSGILVSDRPDAAGLAGGIYYVTATDHKRCTITRPVGITSIDGPVVSIGEIMPATCSYTNDGSASIDISGGNAPFNILWDDGQQAPKAVDLTPGNHLVTITDVNNCQTVGTLSIPAPDPLTIELLEKAEPLCHGDCNGKLKVSAKGGNGDYLFMWDSVEGPEATGLCAGAYHLKVVDQKECVAYANFVLDQPAPITVSLAASKAPRCPEGCDGLLEVKATGGSGTLRYDWSDGSSESLNDNLCAGAYVVTVADAHHCQATDSYTLTDPMKETLDLGGPKTVCAGQTHHLDAGPGEVYSWSSTTDFRSRERQVSLTQAGLYWVEVTSGEGCIVRDTFLLETSSDLLKANFLMTSAAHVADTVVLIDVSWPWPENIQWTLPAEMELLEDYVDMVFGKFTEPGSYDVRLTATLGECRDQISKRISILDGDHRAEAGRLGNESFVKDFRMYPNPNEGKFDVEITFAAETPVILTVFDLLTSRKIAQLTDAGSGDYRKHFDLGPLSAGTYTLRLDYTGGTKYLRFIVR